MSVSDCCPPGSLPSLTEAAEYKQQGCTEMVGDLPIYLVGPSPSLTAIIVGYDIYGFEGGRIRNICDELSQAGHLVVLPDFFRGDCWSAEREAAEVATKMDWIKGISDPDLIRRDLRAVNSYLRTKGVAKTTYVGFCFGGETVAALALQCPQMLLQASNDPENTKANGDVHRVLQELPIGGACVFREFPEMMHGWVPRGNLGDDLVVRDVKAAMAACISFINEYVRKDVTCCLPLPFNG